MCRSILDLGPAIQQIEPDARVFGPTSLLGRLVQCHLQPVLKNETLERLFEYPKYVYFGNYVI